MTRIRVRDAVALAAALLYALLWIGWVAGWGWLHSFDQALLNPPHAYGVEHPGWVHGWNVFSTVFGPEVLRGLVLVLIVVELIRRNYRPAVFLLLTAGGSALVTEVAKTLADRPRPETRLVEAHGMSFPSGHAVGDLVIVGGLEWAYDLSPLLDPKNRIVNLGPVIYSTHPYPLKSRPPSMAAEWDAKFGDVAKIVPVIVGEYGVDDSNTEPFGLGDAMARRHRTGRRPHPEQRRRPHEQHRLEPEDRRRPTHLPQPMEEDRGAPVLPRPRRARVRVREDVDARVGHASHEQLAQPHVPPQVEVDDRPQPVHEHRHPHERQRHEHRPLGLHRPKATGARAAPEFWP